MAKAKLYTRQKSTHDRLQEECGEGGFIRFGNDNAFPQRLIWLYNHSSLNGACIKAKTEAIIGKGLISKTEGILDYANPYESWNDIFKKVAQDFAVFGDYALQVVWSKDRTKIAEVYHVDMSYVRAEEKDEYGNIPGYYISTDWVYSSQGDANYLPTYNKYKASEQPKQLFRIKPYRPGLEYYSLPDYVGSLRTIELDTEIDNFHTNNVQNGLAPSLAITTFSNSSPEEQRWIEKALRNQYGGSENAGSLLYMDVASKEEAPVITPIATNGNDSYYEVMNDMIEQKILTGHRITSPMILGIKTAGALGGRDEMMDAYLLFMNTVINPMQSVILNGFEDLLEVNYGDISIGVETTQLFEDGKVETDVVVSNDANEADSKVLEDETQTVETTIE
tara:strand:- start:2103 stop:3278 length:1176 start_codon:yes stop_codon:yes gene_type:complete